MLTFAIATEADAAPIAQTAYRRRRAPHAHIPAGVTCSRVVTEQGVRHDIKTSRVLVARRGPEIVGTLGLATKKPWAIDLAYFTAVPKVVYLREMAVAPDWQRQGPIGRALVHEAIAVARAWPSQAIRLSMPMTRRPAAGFTLGAASARWAAMHTERCR